DHGPQRSRRAASPPWSLHHGSPRLSVHGSVTAPVTAPAAPPIRAPVPALPVTDPIAAPAPAPSKPPETARSPGVVPHALNATAVTSAAAAAIDFVEVMNDILKLPFGPWVGN